MDELDPPVPTTSTCQPTRERQMCMEMDNLRRERDGAREKVSICENKLETCSLSAKGVEGG